MFKRLLLAYDGLEHSRQALEAALKLAEKFGSQVHVLTVVDDLPKGTTTIYETEATLQRSIRRIEPKHALPRIRAMARLQGSYGHRGGFTCSVYNDSDS